MSLSPLAPSALAQGLGSCDAAHANSSELFHMCTQSSWISSHSSPSHSIHSGLKERPYGRQLIELLISGCSIYSIQTIKPVPSASASNPIVRTDPRTYQKGYEERSLFPTTSFHHFQGLIDHGSEDYLCGRALIQLPIEKAEGQLLEDDCRRYLAKDTLSKESLAGHRGFAGSDWLSLRLGISGRVDQCSYQPGANKKMGLRGQKGLLDGMRIEMSLGAAKGSGSCTTIQLNCTFIFLYKFLFTGNNSWFISSSGIHYLQCLTFLKAGSTAFFLLYEYKLLASRLLSQLNQNQLR